jgi:hypothetical protein
MLPKFHREVHSLEGSNFDAQKITVQHQTPSITELKDEYIPLEEIDIKNQKSPLHVLIRQPNSHVLFCLVLTGYTAFNTELKAILTQHCIEMGAQEDNGPLEFFALPDDEVCILEKRNGVAVKHDLPTGCSYEIGALDVHYDRLYSRLPVATYAEGRGSVTSLLSPASARVYNLSMNALKNSQNFFALPL